MTISSSLNLPELLFSAPLKTANMISIFSLFHSPITLSISSVLFLSYPLFLLSLHQSIIFSAEVYRHRYPFCFTFLSHLLSLCPSIISWVLSLISISYPSDSISTETKIKSLSVIGQSMQHAEMECGFCLQLPPFFYFVFGTVRQA